MKPAVTIVRLNISGGYAINVDSAITTTYVHCVKAKTLTIIPSSR